MKETLNLFNLHVSSLFWFILNCCNDAFRTSSLTIRGQFVLLRSYTRYLMQYGKRALDMLASSKDSLRLLWLEQLFSDSQADGDEDGVRLAAAVRLVQAANPGASAAKVEQRFRELQRLRDKMGGLSLDDRSEVKEGGGGGGGAVAARELVLKQEFIEVFHDFCTRPEIYFLLVQFSSNKEFLDTKDLMRFLEAEQGITQVSGQSGEKGGKTSKKKRVTKTKKNSFIWPAGGAKAGCRLERIKSEFKRL